MTFTGFFVFLLFFYKCFYTPVSLSVCWSPHHCNMLSFCHFLLHLLDSIASMPSFFFSAVASLHSMSCLFTCSTVFRCRWFIMQPCFSRTCAQKQCVRGWAWYCSLISRSEAKGWVITSCIMPPLRLNRWLVGTQVCSVVNQGLCAQLFWGGIMLVQSFKLWSNGKKIEEKLHLRLIQCCTWF